MFGFIRKNSGKIIFLFSFFAILFANTFHEQYPDEYDNILGGKYIIHGILPYSGFFSHHGPIAYFLSAIIYIISGTSFVRFRIIYSIFLFLYSIGAFVYIRKSVGRLETNFYYFFLIFLGIASTYFWGHMLTADGLSAFFVTPVLVLIVLKTFYKKIFSFYDLVFISILLSFSLLTSLTILYLIGFIYLFTFYFFLKQISFKLKIKNIIWFFLIMAAPYIFFILYLFLTGSMQDYVYQNVILNQKYYIYNYPSLTGTINPIRYAIIIFHNFFYSFTNLLFQLKDFNFVFPFNITLALANTGLIIYFFIKRQYSLSALLFLSIVYANARSSPLDSSEKDYQSAVYIIISIFSMCFFLSKVFSDLKNEKEYREKIILTPLFILIGLYSFFNALFVFGKFQEKVYQKYMGTASLIYDRPELAPIINEVVSKDDYVWIGPLEFKEYLYLNAKLPTKYHFLIPAMSKSEKIKSEMINDLENHKPKIIFFDDTYSILGSNPHEFGSFFLEFLNKNYITLNKYTENGIKYKSVAPINEEYNLETKFYINKNDAKEIINKMLSLNIIEKETLK